MRRQGRRGHVGYTQRWSSARAQQKPTPNPIRSIDKSRAADWIEGARMASLPLPPGFASRRVESPWPPPRVTSVAASSHLRRGQESRPGKVARPSVVLSRRLRFGGRLGDPGENKRASGGSRDAG